MPIIWQCEQPIGTQIAVWEITEDIHSLEKLLPENIIDKSKPDVFTHPEKQRQWLATRILLGTLLKDYYSIELYKTDFGKLMISNHDHIYISVSHTQKYAAVSISNCNTGIDIETKLEKVERIKHKFLNEPEKYGLHQTPKMH